MLLALYTYPVRDVTFSINTSHHLRRPQLRWVAPYKDESIVILVALMGSNVKYVLVDQGSLTNVLFWDAFVPMDLLQSYPGVLVGLTPDQVEVCGYVDFTTIFGSTIIVNYIIVNTLSSYNILLGCPSLNELNTVVSLLHLKVKFRAQDRSISVLAIDQEPAHKCYKGSMKHRKGTSVLPTSNNEQVHSLDLDP
ncbi:hypothetical protein CR513_29978, partial [Mucuna pruriens]